MEYCSQCFRYNGKVFTVAIPGMGAACGLRRVNKYIPVCLKLQKTVLLFVAVMVSLPSPVPDMRTNNSKISSENKNKKAKITVLSDRPRKSTVWIIKFTICYSSVQTWLWRFLKKKKSRNSDCTACARSSMIRRLMTRHRYPLPEETIVRIWRELVSSVSLLQTDWVLLFMSHPKFQNIGIWRVIIFGSVLPMQRASSTSETLDLVRSGNVTFAVIPFPDKGLFRPLLEWTYPRHWARKRFGRYSKAAIRTKREL